MEPKNWLKVMIELPAYKDDAKDWKRIADIFAKDLEWRSGVKNSRLDIEGNEFYPIVIYPKEFAISIGEFMRKKEKLYSIAKEIEGKEPLIFEEIGEISETTQEGDVEMICRIGKHIKLIYPLEKRIQLEKANVGLSKKIFGNTLADSFVKFSFRAPFFKKKKS